MYSENNAARSVYYEPFERMKLLCSALSIYSMRIVQVVNKDLHVHVVIQFRDITNMEN